MRAKLTTDARTRDGLSPFPMALVKSRHCDILTDTEIFKRGLTVIHQNITTC